jgi:hypothetical protein
VCVHTPTNVGGDSQIPPWHNLAGRPWRLGWPKPSPRYPRRLAAAVVFLRCISFFRRLSGERISMGPPLGAPRGLCLYTWRDLGRAPPFLARNLPWERNKLDFHKLSLIQIFLIRRSPSLPATYLACSDSK